METEKNITCIVCGHKTWKYLFPARDRMFDITGHFAEYCCCSCGLIRLAPQPKDPKKYYPSVKYYSYNSRRKQSFFGLLRTFLITHSMLRFVPAMPSGKKGRILDIGCGNGETLALLQRIGWDVYGLDIDVHAVSDANKRGLQKVQLGTYKSLRRYRDHYFDAIRMYHVIEHLDDPAYCLRLASKKLKKGGELIIGTPNADSILAKIFRERWYNLDAPRHFFTFTPKTLSRLIRLYAFKADKISFASAGGIVGSIQYALRDMISLRTDLVNVPFLVIVIYPLEWILDRFRTGDVMIMRAFT